MRRLGTIFLSIAAVASAPLAAQQRPETVRHAATEPLRDARIKDEKIPEVLQLAASAPYSSEGTRSCAAIATEIGKLNGALGPDVDAPAKKKGEGAAAAAIAARTAVNTLIPGLGLVRVITGADKQQRRVEAAVFAGNVRRSFLKGIGTVRGCRAPAAPTAAALADTPSLPDAE